MRADGCERRNIDAEIGLTQRGRIETVQRHHHSVVHRVAGGVIHVNQRFGAGPARLVDRNKTACWPIHVFQ